LFDRELRQSNSSQQQVQFKLAHSRSNLLASETSTKLDSSQRFISLTIDGEYFMTEEKIRTKELHNRVDLIVQEIMPNNLSNDLAVLRKRCVVT
jgi:hypothetical protein